MKKVSKWCLLHCLLILIVIFKSSRVVQAADEQINVSVNIGVLYTENEHMSLNCINMSLSHFYNSHPHYNTRIALYPISYPKDTPLAAPSAALHLLKYFQVKAIIMGPATSADAEFVTQFGDKAQVPIISFTPTIPSFLTTRQSSYFINAAPTDSSQIKALTALMQAFEWRDLIPIYQENGYASGLILRLDDAVQRIGVRIPSHVPIHLSATDDQLLQMLHKLKARQTRVFLVHMSPELAARLFLRVNELKMMEKGYAWITTSSITDELGSLNNSVIEAMEGVIGVETLVPDTEKLNQFKRLWDKKSKDMKLNVMGLWAYDAASALARAVEEINVPNYTSKMGKVAGNVNDLDSLGVSSIGPELLKSLLNTNFSGLAGNFSVTDGQLVASSRFKIINVLDNGIRTVGFWTPENRLTQKLSARGGEPATSADLKTVIWPGDTASPPKGWEIPVGGNKLKVGVPVKPVYEKLVNVTPQSSCSNKEISKPTGHCIEIFEAVMKKLGYSEHYEYCTFSLPNGSSAGSYDDLVRQVYLQKYDIVVGDITILLSRTEHVDFTLPYTESGVTMVVPVRNDKQSGWVFLKPLTWDLWVTIVASFAIIALVIWILEHKINEDFQGPALHQLGTSLFYSFSMMVFAQKENVLNNLSRLVVVVWVFVVLILTQSYTASLTSLLTVEQLQPTVTSVDELKSTGAYVGVQVDTFVGELLIKKGFHPSKILSYNSTEDLDILLSNKTIAAVFDEIPYMKLFLNAYPTNYMMLPPLYPTDGFGFALPKGSPLVRDISREILRIIEENGSLVSYDSDLGMQLYNISDPGNKVSSSRLDVGCFWGLFLIVAGVSAFSLCFFFGMFLHQHWDIWLDSGSSKWNRLQRLAKAFLQPDTAAQKFRKKEEQRLQNNKETYQACRDEDAKCEILNTNTPPRLSNFSDQIDDSLAIPVAETPSPKLEDNFSVTTDVTPSTAYRTVCAD